MQLNRIAKKAATILGASVFAIVLVSCDDDDSKGDFAGQYETKDTRGNPMQITLLDDGKSTGTRDGEDLKGTWKKDHGKAVIKWSTGWTTVISEDGVKYSVTAHKPPVSATKID